MNVFLLTDGIVPDSGPILQLLQSNGKRMRGVYIWSWQRSRKSYSVSSCPVEPLHFFNLTSYSYGGGAAEIFKENASLSDLKEAVTRQVNRSEHPRSLQNIFTGDYPRNYI